MERRLAGAAIDGLTRSNVTNATSRGVATNRTPRAILRSGSTMTRWIGCLNSDQRSSLSLTHRRTPTITVSMYCSTTEAGTGALATPINGGR